MIPPKEPQPEPMPMPPLQPAPELKPWHWRIHIVKGLGESAKIGMDTVARQSHFEGPCLKVKKVKEGLVSDWNSAHPDREVKAGDYMLEVNGVRGNTERLYEAIGSNITIDIVLSRPPPDSIPPRRTDAS